MMIKNRIHFLPLTSVLCILSLLLPFFPFQSVSYAAGSSAKTYPVGMRTYGIWDIELNERSDIVVWYPSTTVSNGRQLDGWRVTAAGATRVLPGFYPVILVSHDTASSRFANNDLAIALASHGFIVIVPTHTGDNLYDSSQLYTADILVQRPRQLLRALETVLDAPEITPYMDESRIGLLGIGFGSISVAQLAGLTPSPNLLKTYCSQQTTPDVFCTYWSGNHLNNVKDKLVSLEKKYGAQALTPHLALFAPLLEAAPLPVEQPDTEKVKSTDEVSHEALLASSIHRITGVDILGSNKSNNQQDQEFVYLLDFQGGELLGGTISGGKFTEFEDSDVPHMRISVEQTAPPVASTPSPAASKPDLRPHRRPASFRQLRSIAFVAPAGGMLFSPDEAHLLLPAVIVNGANDTLYPYAQHGAPFEALFDETSQTISIARADHFSLFAPCSEELLTRLGEICSNDRKNYEEVTNNRDAAIIPFFLATLGGPGPQPDPSGFVAVTPEMPQAEVNATAKPLPPSKPKQTTRTQ